MVNYTNQNYKGGNTRQKPDVVKELRRRMEAYERAIAMASGKIRTDNSFVWPPYPAKLPKDPRNITYWSGCLDELKRIISTLERGQQNRNAGNALPLKANSTGIKVAGKVATWRVIDVTKDYKGDPVFLLEHELYGPATETIVVDKYAHLLPGTDHLFHEDVDYNDYEEFY